MTNAEKYLKDGIIYHNLACEIALHISNSLKSGLVQNIDDFFKQQAKQPALNENERAILESINSDLYEVIGRDDSNDLYFDDQDRDFNIYVTTLFGHLFQFIEPR